MRRCESCGKVYSDDRDIICSHCGAVALKKCSGDSRYDSKYSESRDEKYHYDEEILENDTRYEKNGKSINIPSFKMPNAANDKFKKVCVVLIAAVLLYSVIVPIFNVAFENITYPDYTETVAADDFVHCDAYVARSVSDTDSDKFALYIKPYRSTDASIYKFEDSPFWCSNYRVALMMRSNSSTEFLCKGGSSPVCMNFNLKIHLTPIA